MTKRNKVFIILAVIVLAALLTGSTYCYCLRDNMKQQVSLPSVPLVSENFLKERVKELEEQKDIAENIEVSKSDGQKERYLGTFRISAYCSKSCCNGSNANKTATGKTMIPYKTAAVDPRIIPLGSNLKIECDGKIYYVTANDTGGAIKGNKIDMNINTHQNALKWGIRYGKVWILQ